MRDGFVTATVVGGFGAREAGWMEPISYARHRFPPSVIRQAVRSIDHQPRFEIMPRCWMVEPTVSSMTQWQRPVRDYEHRMDVCDAMTPAAMKNLLLRRINN